MQYKLINKNTKQENLCVKIVIDGFDYYVINVHPEVGQWCIDPHGNLTIFGFDFRAIFTPKELNYVKKIIATNNLSLVQSGLPMVINQTEKLAEQFVKDKLKLSSQAVGVLVGFIEGHNAAKETHPYDADDIEEFIKWKDNNRWYNFENGKWNYTFEHGMSISKGAYEKNYRKTTKELLDIWKEQTVKTLYYI
jgi:hypothetical protein